MNALSKTQANRCENAVHPQCRCRCGGALHGAARGGDVSFFERLPADDPHKIPDAAEKRARANYNARKRSDIKRSLKRIERGEQPLAEEFLFTSPTESQRPWTWDVGQPQEEA